MTEESNYQEDVTELIQSLHLLLEALESAQVKIKGSPARALLECIGDLIALLAKTWKHLDPVPSVEITGDDLLASGKFATRTPYDLFGLEHVYSSKHVPRSLGEEAKDKRNLVRDFYFPVLGPELPPGWEYDPEENVPGTWIKVSNFDPVNRQYIIPSVESWNKPGISPSPFPLSVKVDLGQKFGHLSRYEGLLISDFIDDVSEIFAGLSLGSIDFKLIKAIHRSLRISSTKVKRTPFVARYRNILIKEVPGPKERVIKPTKSAQYFRRKRVKHHGKAQRRRV
jgi:hypothetical protein